jgi:hypothetical protein
MLEFLGLRRQAYVSCPDAWIRRLGNLPELASVGVGLTAS